MYSQQNDDKILSLTCISLEYTVLAKTINYEKHYLIYMKQVFYASKSKTTAFHKD